MQSSIDFGGGPMHVQRSYSLPKYEGFSNGSDGSNGKISSKMTLISLGVNALALFLGFILFIGSFTYLYSAISRTGMIVSFLVIAAGAVGISDTVLFKSVQVKTFYMVGLVLLITMLFGFTNQVEFVVADDCVKAELYIRVNGIQETLNKQKTDDLMLNVVTRMKEMEDMMDMLASEDIGYEELKKFELNKEEKKNLGDIDKYIRMKIVHLKQHAKDVLAKMDQQLVSVRQETEQRARSGQRMTVEEMERVRDYETGIKFRIERVQEAVEYMDANNQQIHMQPEDYHAILDLLSSGSGHAHEGLNREKENQKNVGELIGEYHKLYEKKQKADSMAAQAQSLNPADLQKMQSSMVERNKLTDDFWKLFRENKQASKFHEKVIEHLPSHCMVEFSHEPYFVALVWGIILCLGTGMYIMFTSAFIQVASKKQI